jgi:hypothetical protein
MIFVVSMYDINIVVMIMMMMMMMMFEGWRPRMIGSCGL